MFWRQLTHIYMDVYVYIQRNFIQAHCVYCKMLAYRLQFASNCCQLIASVHTLLSLRMTMYVCVCVCIDVCWHCSVKHGRNWQYAYTHIYYIIVCVCTVTVYFVAIVAAKVAELQWIRGEKCIWERQEQRQIGQFESLIQQNWLAQRKQTKETSE